MLKRPGMPMHGPGMGGYPMKRSRVDKTFTEKTGCRVLLPSKMAGCLIGKGGATIKKMREDFDCSVRIPDCAGPERVLEIVGKEWEAVFNCLEACIPYLYECPEGVDTGGSRELRFLVHQAIAGAIIGKGGANIKEIRETSGTQMKVYSNAAPQSTDRCVQVDGNLENVMNAAREIYRTVMDYTLTAHESIYDPENYDSFYAHEYGGYGGGAKARPPMPPMGGMPPMGMRGQGGFGRGMGPRGPGFGPRHMADDSFMGEFGGGFRGGEFSGYGNGFGNRSRPMGTKAKPVKLEFTVEDENTCKTIIEKDLAGAVIGIGGQRIRKIRSDSGATIQISNPENDQRTITIIGDQEATGIAKHLLQSAIYEFAGGP